MIISDSVRHAKPPPSRGVRVSGPGGMAHALIGWKPFSRGEQTDDRTDGTSGEPDTDYSRTAGDVSGIHVSGIHVSDIH